MTTNQTHSQYSKESTFKPIRISIFESYESNRNQIPILDNSPLTMNSARAPERNIGISNKI